MRKRPGKKAPARTQKKTLPASDSAVEAQAPSPAAPPADPPMGDGRLQKSLVALGGALATRQADPEPDTENFVLRKQKAMQLVALKIGGMDLKEAAESLSINYGYARNLISLAGKYGWFTPTEPMERLENVIAHKAVNNVEEFLNHPHPMLRMDMTKEVMKGIGLFKAHTANKDEGQRQTTILAIKIENPGANVVVDQKTIEGKVGGVPQYVDGDVIS